MNRPKCYCGCNRDANVINLWDGEVVYSYGQVNRIGGGVFINHFYKTFKKGL
jgi:hypothetical protein